VGSDTVARVGIRVALTVAASVCVFSFIAASADARPHPEALGATLQYISAFTSSCEVSGANCASLEPFAVTMRTVGIRRYRLSISNTRATDHFRYFAWIVPDSLTLHRVVSSRAGDCGIANSMISCVRKLPAHGCACSQPDLVVDFTAQGQPPTRAKLGYWIWHGLVTAYLDVPSTFNDVPICDVGEKSTSAHPCLK
jgi:hypothetical protein